MKEFHLCPKIIAQIEAQMDRRVEFSNFPKSHQVTYRYFVGRVAVYRHEFGLADEALSFAYSNCPPQAFKNQR